MRQSAVDDEILARYILDVLRLDDDPREQLVELLESASDDPTVDHGALVEEIVVKSKTMPAGKKLSVAAAVFVPNSASLSSPDVTPPQVCTLF